MRIPDETLSEKFAGHYAALQFNQIPSAVIDAAKLHLLDSVGCLLAGSRLEAGKLAYDLAVATSGAVANSTSTLFGTVRQVSFLDAVQAMSVAAHCGEMDDIHSGAGTCVGAMVVPCLFIASLRRDLSVAQERQLLQSWHFKRLTSSMKRSRCGPSSSAAGSSSSRVGVIAVRSWSS